MTTLTARTLPTALACLLFLGPACVVVDDDEPADTTDPGQVEIAWALGGRSCTEAGIATIEARLVDTGGTVFAEATEPCEDGRAVLGPVAPGIYRLIIQGASRDGVITHQGGHEAVTVEEGETARPAKVNLQARGAVVTVVWWFANGRLCSVNGVATVELAVFDDLGREVHLMDYECDPEGPVTLDNVPAGQMDFIGTAKDAAKEPLFRDHERLTTTFGGEARVELVLEDCEVREGGCL